MSNIPLARDMIDEVVAALTVRGHRDLAVRLLAARAELFRRPMARKPARRRSPPVDAELAEALRRYARLHPDMPNRAIGQRFGVDGGRVSEALHGDR